jgi:hypothetical protein
LLAVRRTSAGSYYDWTIVAVSQACGEGELFAHALSLSWFPDRYQARISRFELANCTKCEHF